MSIKNFIRKTLNTLHLDLTKNLKYDRLTKKVLSIVVKKDSVCIDIGCHKGEILDLILKYAPDQKHYAFEPIPVLFNQLEQSYSHKANLFNCALSDKSGSTTFQFVKNAPAYSGILKRRYDIENPDIEELTVQMETLDAIIPKDQPIRLIKIDVEGGEFPVLKGARETLLRNKPFIVFECGTGGSEFYDTKPEDLYDYLCTDIGLNIYLLDQWLAKKDALTKADFVKIFHNNSDYYFLAGGGGYVEGNG